MDLSHLQRMLGTQFVPTSSATVEQVLQTKSALTLMLVNNVVNPDFPIQLRPQQSPYLQDYVDAIIPSISGMVVDDSFKKAMVDLLMALPRVSGTTFEERRASIQPQIDAFYVALQQKIPAIAEFAQSAQRS